MRLILQPAGPSGRWKAVRAVLVGLLSVAVLELVVARELAAQLVSPDVRVSTLSWPWPQLQPTVATGGGATVAVWSDGGRSCFARSGWAWSSDGGMTWTAESTPAFDAEPAICAGGEGEFFVLSTTCSRMLVRRGEWNGSGIVWGDAVMAVEDVPVSAPVLAADPVRGHLFFTYWKHAYWRGATEVCTRKLVRSLDGGNTWIAPADLDSLCGDAMPAVGPDGEMYVVWCESEAGKVVGRKSLNFGASFGPPFVVGELRDNRGSPPPGYRTPIRLGDGSTQTIPAIAVDRSAGPRRGTVYVAWPEYGEGTVGPFTSWVYEQEPNDFRVNATPIQIGQDVYGWADAGELYPDRIDVDNFMFEGTAGQTVWIESRVEDEFPILGPPIWTQRAFYLQCAADTGNIYLELAAPFIRDTRYYPPWPPMILTLPYTGAYYFRLGAYSWYSTVFYRLKVREYTPTGTSAARDHRDIVMVRSTDGGATWSGKVRVNDGPPRFDNVLPALAVDGSGRVHAAWYDRRDDPVCGLNADTYWAMSEDGGASFGPAVRLSSQSSWWRPFADVQTNIGERLGLAAEGDGAVVVWTQLDRPDIDVYGARIELGATPVAVSGFRAEAEAALVRLRWQVGDAAGIAAFRVHRAEEEGHYVLLGEQIPPRGLGDYAYEDWAVESGRLYRYRLEVVRSGAASQWEGPVEALVHGVPARLAWRRVAPNPFGEAVRLELAVPRAGRARVGVYDVAGHEVARLVEGAVLPGSLPLQWSGQNRSGRPVPAGVYLVRAELNGETTSQRIVRVR